MLLRAEADSDYITGSVCFFFFFDRRELSRACVRGLWLVWLLTGGTATVRELVCV